MAEDKDKVNGQYVDDDGQVHNNFDDIVEQANFVRDELLPQMDVLRGYADAAEAVVDAKLWPLPTYGELLFGVR